MTRFSTQALERVGSHGAGLWERIFVVSFSRRQTGPIPSASVPWSPARAAWPEVVAGLPWRCINVYMRLGVSRSVGIVEQKPTDAGTEDVAPSSFWLKARPGAGSFWQEAISAMDLGRSQGERRPGPTAFKLKALVRAGCSHGQVKSEARPTLSFVILIVATIPFLDFPGIVL